MPKCEHEPIEQTRGQMGSGDYFDVLENKRIVLAISEEDLNDYHNRVEVDETNKSDVRIICHKCHHTTGWNKADAPGMPGAGLDFIRRKWDEIKQYDVEEWAAIVRKNAVRPKIVNRGGK